MTVADARKLRRGNLLRERTPGFDDYWLVVKSLEGDVDVIRQSWKGHWDHDGPIWIQFCGRAAFWRTMERIA
jgi:hypothetical protein